jgi:hypothetical protein
VKSKAALAGGLADSTSTGPQFTGRLKRRDTSADDMSYAVSLANQGRPHEVILRALTAKPSGKRDPGSLKYQRILETKGKATADAYAERTVQAAAKFVKANPPIRDRNAALVRLGEIQNAAESLPWCVYAGPGVRRSLEATFVVAERVGSIKFGLALREWAQVSGQDFETVRANRNPLVSLGWLVRNEGDRPGRTSRFTLRKPSHIQLTPGDMNVEDIGSRAWLTHDAFRPQAFGDIGWYLLAKIARAPILNVELAAATGISRQAWSDYLAPLERAGLVLVSDQGGVGLPRGDLIPLLDAAAVHFGTAGAADRDNARIARERVAFRGRLQDVNVGDVA